MYKATVKCNNSVKHYIGATEGTIKFTTINFLSQTETTHPTPPYPPTYGLKKTQPSLLQLPGRYSN